MMMATGKDMHQKDGGEESKKILASMPKKSRRLQGMKMRDEFLCPITYELLREPVVALDGHTYEKSAIEKWLKSNHTSPRNGETMEDSIVPNLNLKKLIQDMINEGGAGLYTNDICDSERLFDVFAEKVLILKCVGPPESDWNMQSFQVTHLGCVGGRKTLQEDPGSNGQHRDCMLFRDTTVSRRHFEISAVQDKPGKYAIQDLGSAGGTFIRIQTGQKKRLHAGMMLLLGKHQFIVSSIDDSGTSESVGSHSVVSSSPTTSLRKEISSKLKSRRGSSNLVGSGNAALDELVSQSEQLVADLSMSETRDENQEELEKRLRELNDWLTYHLSPSGNVNKNEDESKDDRKNTHTKISGTGIRNRTGFQMDGKFASKEMGYDSDSDSAAMTHDVPKGKGAGGHSVRIPEGSHPYSGKRCTITCFNPDGSPLQGRSFVVGCQGASLGRKPTNDIVLSLSVPNESGGLGEDEKEAVVNIDTAISSDHARIEMDHANGCFYIIDGTPFKPSLNGTWFRLSGPHQNSPLFPIEPKMELLIGVLRFSVSESMTISEKAVDSNGGGTGTSSGISGWAGSLIRGVNSTDDQESKETARRQDSHVHTSGGGGGMGGLGSGSGGTCASSSTGCLSAITGRGTSATSGTSGSMVRRSSISSALSGRRSDASPNHK